MKIALYARVSSSDKNQNPDTQLLPLRDFAKSQNWETFREYVDRAPANDLEHRTAWRNLLDDAAKGRFQSVLVLDMDRAFKSARHMHDTLAVWDAVGVKFQSLRGGFDTSTAIGRLQLNCLACMEKCLHESIRKGVKAGMDSARKQGARIGRPRVTERRGFSAKFAAILERVKAGLISRRKAAEELGVSYATLKRLLDNQHGESPEKAK